MAIRADQVGASGSFGFLPLLAGTLLISLVALLIAVPVGLWREATINTMVPAPTEEEQKDGEFRFHFGPMDAGETLEFKIDGQLNPPLFGVSRGAIRLLDDDAPLAAQPTRLEVLP